MSPKRGFTGEYTGQYMLKPGKDWKLDQWKAAVEKAKDEKKTIYEVIYCLLEKWMKEARHA